MFVTSFSTLPVLLIPFIYPVCIKSVADSAFPEKVG